jgi:hypothetical protein
VEGEPRTGTVGVAHAGLHAGEVEEVRLAVVAGVHQRFAGAVGVGGLALRLCGQLRRGFRGDAGLTRLLFEVQLALLECGEIFVVALDLRSNSSSVSPGASRVSASASRALDLASRSRDGRGHDLE